MKAVPRLQRGWIMSPWALQSFTPPTWDVDTLATSRRWATCAIGGGVCVVAGLNASTSRPCVNYSTDFGANWTDSPTSFGAAGGVGFFADSFDYGNGIFMGGLNATTLCTSPDGINWSYITTSSFVKTLLFFDPYASVFVIVPVNTADVYYTVDGSIITGDTLPASRPWAAGCVDASSGTIILGNSDGTVRKTVGGAWSSESSYPWSPGLDGPRFMAAGNGIVVATTLDLTTKKVAYSADGGVTWAYSDQVTAADAAFGRVRFIGGKFYMMTLSCDRSFTSDDGQTWTEESAMPSTPGGCDWATDGGTHFIACGNSGSDNDIVGIGSA